MYLSRYLNDSWIDFLRKNVFIKPATIWKKLTPGMKFVFYQSRKDTGLIGEAKIKDIKLIDDPMKVFEMYGDRVFLTKEKLKNTLSYKKNGNRLKVGVEKRRNVGWL